MAVARQSERNNIRKNALCVVHIIVLPPSSAAMSLLPTGVPVSDDVAENLARNKQLRERNSQQAWNELKDLRVGFLQRLCTLRNRIIENNKQFRDDLTTEALRSPLASLRCKKRRRTRGFEAAATTSPNATTIGGMLRGVDCSMLDVEYKLRQVLMASYFERHFVLFGSTLAADGSNTQDDEEKEEEEEEGDDDSAILQKLEMPVTLQMAAQSQGQIYVALCDHEAPDGSCVDGCSAELSPAIPFLRPTAVALGVPAKLGAYARTIKRKELFSLLNEQMVRAGFAALEQRDPLWRTWFLCEYLGLSRADRASGKSVLVLDLRAVAPQRAEQVLQHPFDARVYKKQVSTTAPSTASSAAAAAAPVVIV